MQYLGNDYYKFHKTEGTSLEIAFEDIKKLITEIEGLELNRVNNSIKEIEKFQIDRNLNKQEYNPINEATNTIEEVLESLGYGTSKNKRKALTAQLLSFISTLLETNTINKVTITTEDRVDAYADIIVFAIGAIMKLGYEPNEVLGETAKEINSRVGSMVDGKFEKGLSDEAKSNWYKADYSKYKVKD